MAKTRKVNEEISENKKVDLDKEAVEAWKTFNRTGNRSKIANVCAACIEKMDPRSMWLILRLAVKIRQNEILIK